MENLALHIEYLLLRHDCVIVPGLGAYINMREEANYDTESGIWRPMKSEVVFNADIRNDDGLLANSVARKYKISFREARELIEKEVDSLKESLKLDGEYTLGSIGILRAGEDDRLVFSPFKSRETILTDFCFPEIIRKTPVEVSADTTREDGIIEEKSRRFDIDKNYYIAVNKNFARAAAIFIILFIFSVVGIILPERKPTQDRASVAPVVENLIDTALRNVIPQKEEGSSNIVPEDSDSGKDNLLNRDTYSYHLIVGTFRTEKEADKFIELNKEKGYKLSPVSSSSLIRIAAAGSEEKDDLVKLMNSEEFRNVFAQAWIWHEERQDTKE